METQVIQRPPMPPPRVALGFAGDDIEELAERIAGLTLKQVVELTEYLKTREVREV